MAMSSIAIVEKLMKAQMLSVFEAGNKLFLFLEVKAEKWSFPK